MHCKNFSFKDIEKSIKPSGISDFLGRKKMTEGKFIKKVVVLCCIEASDLEKEAKDSSIHINHMIKTWHGNNRNVIILPFGHLSSNLADPEKSQRLLEILIKELKRLGNRVKLITFGTHKEWLVDVYGYPRATSWFQFP